MTCIEMIRETLASRQRGACPCFRILGGGAMVRIIGRRLAVRGLWPRDDAVAALAVLRSSGEIGQSPLSCAQRATGGAS